MENLALSDLDKICRVCLVEEDNMYSIYTELSSIRPDVKGSLTIDEILTKISHIKMQQNDGFPSMICTNCLKAAYASHKFQNQCTLSQNILEAYMRKHRDESFSLGKSKEKRLDVQTATSYESLESESDSEILLRGTSITDEVSDEDVLQEDPPGDSSKVNLNAMIDSTKITNGERSYSCTLCDKSYKYSSSLRAHIKNHSQEKPYSCKICEKSFKHCTSLVYHKRSHTGEQPYSCKLCGKKYKQSGTLTAHMRVHTGQKPFLCSICGRGFRQAADLGYHMRSHTKEKPYMCSVCGKTMSMQSHLVQHMRSHTGERPFKCNVCDKAFPSSTRLKRHAIIHTNIRPYTCDVCSKSFNRSSSLKVHSKIHTDERSHVCPICSKGFIQAHALRYHLTSHSSEHVNLL